MEGAPIDLADVLRAIAHSGARAMLIGRQALILVGLPVNTADIDLWLHADDIAKLNQALEPLGLVATRTPDQARAAGRYVLENDERVDVLVARGVLGSDGTDVHFEDVWGRRREIEVATGVSVWVPTLDDLIATKRFGRRPHDAEDIRMLEELRRRGGS